MSSNIQFPTENQAECINLQLDVQSQKHGIQNRTRRYVIPKKKKTERKRGCRCGSATPIPGKQTCFGQRCSCYTEQKSCERCKCRGCRNPRQKSSNIDDNLKLDLMCRKPMTLELVSSLKPSHIKNKPKTERQRGCRCGSAIPIPGKQTCFGQRCPCYTEQKSCERCKCRGCRNPRQKSSNIDDNLKIDQMSHKPVTLELVSPLKSSHIKKQTGI